MQTPGGITGIMGLWCGPSGSRVSYACMDTIPLSCKGGWNGMRRLWVFVVLLAMSVVAAGAVTPLDVYLDAADAAYSYTLARTDKLEGATAYVLDMTSQSWRSDKEVNRTLWRHWMVIVKP
ncbi:MAG TPA: hypothetical protein ENN81_04900, partial [Phycisphaerales bacterium]|nr:hypothetical protein [Phycisphaerales bacterium]